jgi:Heterokaryon incompatibility protein (HET)
MRLISVTSKKLEEFFDADIPQYAILSHTWGPGEVSFQDINCSNVASKAGYKKIEFICSQAIQHGLSYAWVDTCCIDKSSSAELSEAINSMFNWYKKATRCYAYLADVIESKDLLEHILNTPHHKKKDVYASSFGKSRWWTRGWTLQELLAPADVEFYNSLFEYLLSRRSAYSAISIISGIDNDLLMGQTSLANMCVARKMSWAASRKTTRTEDQAYSLLGIFNINMPLLYGEGPKAFQRLQEEIIKSSNDQSILAWEAESQASSTLLLAPCVECFQNAGNVRLWDAPESHLSFSLTSTGLNITLPLIQGSNPEGWTAILACRYKDDFSGPLGIPLHDSGRGEFFCNRPQSTQGGLKTANLETISEKLADITRSMVIRRSKENTKSDQISHARIEVTRRCWINLDQFGIKRPFRLHSCHPIDDWDRDRGIFHGQNPGFALCTYGTGLAFVLTILQSNWLECRIRLDKYWGTPPRQLPGQGEEHMKVFFRSYSLNDVKTESKQATHQFPALSIGEKVEDAAWTRINHKYLVVAKAEKEVILGEGLWVVRLGMQRLNT